MVYYIGEKKLIKIKKLTAKWLKEKEACGEGLKWFKRNYPGGLILTKKNINKFVGKLLNITASGAADTTRYGVYSALTGAGGGASTNIAGYFSAQNATNNYGLIVENGYVGIGTTAPDVKLEIAGADTTVLQLGDSSTEGGDIYVYRDGSGNAQLILDADAAVTGVALQLYGGIAFLDSDLKIYSSADGQLDVDADTELELTYPIIQLVAATN